MQHENIIFIYYEHRSKICSIVTSQLGIED